jgi:tyrosyl-tRNA synthetase
VLTMPLLVGLDGKQKMSKSLDNYVGITETATDQYGKLMSLPDDTMPEYFALATGWPAARIAEVSGDLQSGRLSARDAKRLLARTVVELYHGDGAGDAAEAMFDRVFVAHEAPDDVPEVQIPAADVRDGRIRMATLVARSFPTAVGSNKDGRRMIVQGGVRLDGEVVIDADLEVAPADVDGKLLQLGRRNWARLRA